MNFILLQQFRSVPKNIAKKVKNRLLDTNLQAWTAELQSSSKGKHFALFKDNVGFGFKSGICLLIAPCPVHCFSILKHFRNAPLTKLFVPS